MILLTGNSNLDFATNVCKSLGQPLGECTIGRFNNGEIRLDIDVSLRGETVYIIFSSGGEEINAEIMEILSIAHAAHYASAEKIVLIATCFPYARQDRKTKSRDLISARMIMDLCRASHVDHIISIDLHNGAIQGFSDIPTDNLSPVAIFRQVIKENIFPQCSNPSDDIVIVSPDAGGFTRVQHLAEDLHVKTAMIYKERKDAGVVYSMELLGNVRGKICVLYDDMADSCGTLCKAVTRLKTAGAINVYAVITHGILSGDAVDLVDNSEIVTLYLTDSVNMKGKIERSKKIKIVSVTSLIAMSIHHHNNNRSMAPLFVSDNNELDNVLMQIRN